MPAPREPRARRGAAPRPAKGAGKKARPPKRAADPRKAAPRKATGGRSATGGRKATGGRDATGGRKAAPRKGAPARGGARSSAPRRRDRDERARRDEGEGPKQWGSLARRGAGRLRDDRPSGAAAAFREAAGLEDRPRHEPERWERVDDVRDTARGAVARGRRREPAAVPPSVEEAAGLAGASHVPRLGERLRSASRAFERERFPEARSLLKPLAERAPGSAPVRELYGLTLYRLGQWKAAIKELEAFRTLTGSTEQHPVLADCYRALRRYDEVDELWSELRAASPSAELVAEGRIVAAGALADRDALVPAITLLEAGLKPSKRLKPHQLRLLYVLADLVERAGDIPRARQLFTRVAEADPDFADVEHRRRALG